jgi:beta-lactamase class A
MGTTRATSYNACSRFGRTSCRRAFRVVVRPLAASADREPLPDDRSVGESAWYTSAVISIQLLTGATLLLVAAGVAAKTPSFEEQLAARLGSFRGVMGVAARNLDTGETVLLNADTRFPTASVIKLGVMAEVYERIADGRLRRDTLVTLTDDVKVGGSGVLDHLHGGIQLSVSDLIALMITVSDNTATNLLVGLVGTQAVDDRLVSYGLKDTKLFRPTFRDGKPDVFPELEQEYGLGMATPRELMLLMQRIAEGKIGGRETCDEMLKVLQQQDVLTMIPRSLPEDQDVLVANKSGADSEKVPDANGVRRHIRGDVAYVTAPGLRYVVAILTRQVEDTRWSVDNEALTTGAEVSRRIYDHFKGR